jgi:hypothetical protein
MGSACELECELILSFDLAFIVEAAPFHRRLENRWLTAES